MKRLDARSFVFSAALAAICLTAFQGSASAQAPDVIWLPSNAEWKYYEAGAPALDAGFNAWYETGYNDSGWAAGNAELGFDTSAGSETTTLTRGEVTYYFRTTINVTQPQLDVANKLQLNLVRDDGAVIYVNGIELHRDNMDPGTVVHDTLAASAVAGPDEEREWISNHLSASALSVGQNTIAVEIHQSSAGSSDISFSLGMFGFNFIPILGSMTPPVPLEFINARANDEYYSPLQFPNDPYELGWLLSSRSGENTRVHFTHPKLEIPDFFTDEICLVATGGSATLITDIAGTSHRDADVEGAYLVNISNYTDVTVQFGLRAWDKTGGGMGTSSRAQAWVETSVTGDTFASEQVLDLTGGVPTGLVNDLVLDSSPRKVIVPTSNIGTTWRSTGFSDASWISGTSGAGYDYATYTGPTLDLQSQLAGKNGTLYMRVPFNVTAANLSAYTSLILSMRYDDGFVAFINGVQVEAQNAPTPLAFDSEATGQNSDARAIVWETFDVSPHIGALKVGANILAIHGLNNPRTSSDMLIAPELKAIKAGGGGTNPGEPEILDDITGDIDGPFTIFRYDVPASAQTLRMKYQLNCNSGDNAVMLDKILVNGTPRTVLTYSDWIALNTDYDPDDEGHPTADPDGDLMANLIEYAFGGSPTEPDADLTPTSSIVEVAGQNYFALTWRQRNLSYQGGLGQGERGFQVRDIFYIPEYSTDGISWESNDGPNGPEVAFLISGLEEEAEGEFINVTAAFIDPLTASPPIERIFGRVRIRLIAR